MTMVTLIKGKHLIVMAYIFRGLDHDHHGATWWCAGRHGAREGAGIVQINTQAKGSGLEHWVWREHNETSKPTHRVTSFL